MQEELFKNEQKKIRIRLAAAACAYEFYSISLIDDAQYDALSLQVDLTLHTDNVKLDKWFNNNFTTDSGMWIQTHPQLNRLKQIVEGLIS